MSEILPGTLIISDVNKSVYEDPFLIRSIHTIWKVNSIAFVIATTDVSLYIINDDFTGWIGLLRLKDISVV
jgi:hypothetical protein